MLEPDLIVDYEPRMQFAGFHVRTERFACIVTHRRAGKTVACVEDLQHAAMWCTKVRPRFAYISPFLKQSKAVAWDYLRAATAPLRKHGARVHESELRVDYAINDGQHFAKLRVTHLNRRLSRESWLNSVHPISFMSRVISVCIRPSARSTPAWPATANG
jgi:hypothetical protein